MAVGDSITVYVASPYTIGDVDKNVAVSLIVGDELLKLGFSPFMPLLYHFWHKQSPKAYKTWTTLDLEWVVRCDCLLRLNGLSTGADKEEEVAKEYGKPVFYSLEELRAYYGV